MRKLRRAGKIGEFVSVFVNEKQVNYSNTCVISPKCMRLVYDILYIFIIGGYVIHTFDVM
jgi:hypothetical protein